MPKHARLLMLLAILAAVGTLGPAQLRAQPAAGAPAGDKALGLREAVAALPADFKTPNRHALLIGASDYDDDRIPDLPACRRDVVELEKVLLNPEVGLFTRERVTTLLGADVTRERVTEALDQLGRAAGPGDLVLIFFTGHGATDEKGRAYWVMANSQADKLRSSALPENEVTDLLQDIKTTRMVTLIDSCYSAATAQLKQVKNLNVNDIVRGFDGDGRVALTASKGDQLSVVIRKQQDHPGLGHSAFAWHLIEGLRGQADADADGVVTVDELWGHVKDRTAQTARMEGGNQLPQLKGQLGGRFLLTLNPPKLLEKHRLENEARTLNAQRKATLTKAYERDEITRAEYFYAEALLKKDPSTLNETEQERKSLWLDFADGRIRPAELRKKLDLALGDEDRAIAMKVEAEKLIQAEKQRRADEWAALALGAMRRSDYGKANEATLEALRILPNHAPARDLQKKLAELTAPKPPPTPPVTTPPAAAIKPGQSLTLDLGGGVKLELAPIPAGKFMMGSPGSEEGRANDETQHEVTISKPFHMGIHEVTQAQWKAVMGANPSEVNGDDLPVDNVIWDDAVEFCRKLSEKTGRTVRLPTEAEWEYACRAGTTTPFHFGATISTAQANYNGTDTYGLLGAKGVYREKTIPVGSLNQPNAWGLHDMHGNVWEWCVDWYGKYPEGKVADPTGAPNGEYRVVRGGSWYYKPQYCRAACRGRISPDRRDRDVGFRVVASPAPGLP